MREGAMSPAQLHMLLNIRDYADPWRGISGRSAHGGATGTMFVLKRKGLIYHTGMAWVLTDAGKQALIAHGESDV